MKSGKILLLILFGSLLILPIVLLSSSFAASFLKGLGLTIGILTVLWIISLLIKDASIIDIYWGLGFVIIAWFYAYLTGIGELSVKNRLFLLMISIWGIRLSAYLAFRNLGKGEDYRYVQMRQEGGKNWWWISYLRVFVLQGILLWIISSIFLPAFSANTEFSFLDYLGIALWSIGFFFEAVGDWQMMQFKKLATNKGKVMDHGLWKYTRHPNYFGDTLLWWGFFCFCLSHPQGIFFIFSPLLMNFLLLKISGVAMLERGLKKSKVKYKDYIRRTSAFIPMWPNK